MLTLHLGQAVVALKAFCESHHLNPLTKTMTKKKQNQLSGVVKKVEVLKTKASKLRDEIRQYAEELEDIVASFDEAEIELESALNSVQEAVSQMCRYV